VARSALVLAALALTAVCSASASTPKVSLARGEQPRADEPWPAALRARPGLRIVLAARNAVLATVDVGAGAIAWLLDPLAGRLYRLP
jgi:hypothetical protein